MAGLVRTALLAGSKNEWLRSRATRYRFVKQSVSKFMPGERLEDALGAARHLEADGCTSLLTRLGENVTTEAAADEVAVHYEEVIRRVTEQGIDAHISVKLTQLGLDLSTEGCVGRLRRLVEVGASSGGFVWVDMEDSSYIDRTIGVFRAMHAVSPRVGLCLQTYLKRTAADLDGLIGLGPAIRLVKGAYAEPPDLVLPRKRDVDENFYRLSCRLIDAHQASNAFLAIGTHDAPLVERLRWYIGSSGASRNSYEFQMLYGINLALQQQLTVLNKPLRVLISYGEHWFPWYMRRLAERPANIWFVAKHLIS